VASEDQGCFTRGEFSTLMTEKLHLRDQQVIDSLFRFWDLNGDGLIAFHELVQNLHLMCHGTKTAQLRKFFDVYDLDHNHTISPEEFKHIIHAFFPNRSKKEVEQKTADLFTKIDMNGDMVISFKEFERLGSEPNSPLLTVRNSFNMHVIELFGLSQDDVEESDF